MFPYPSASGLHVGHAFNYIIGDIYSRFKRMNNFNVLYPMGYDAFGLPAENAAIKVGIHPRKFTEDSINTFTKQQKELGLSYDWDRMLKTCDEDYYKWNQYFFLKFMEKGLVYRKNAPVNWCPECNTVLANEQVKDGKCWRHQKTLVQEKHLEQWFIKTTKYSDELLDKVDSLAWPDRIKIMQKNWIGKSYGTEINFKINDKSWPIFTTRPDTIYGVTFMVVSAQHPRLNELVIEKQKKEVESFLKKIKTLNEEELEKEGAFTGSYAINPLTNEKVPVWAGNFVIADYGSGMVMAVPAHDARDYDFAKKYKIPIKEVIKGGNIKKQVYTEKGILINSEKFSGLDNEKAKQEITKYLENKKLGKKDLQYKFRDWLISRQRYWGTPIPVTYCKKCGIVPIPYNELPIKLPEKVKFGEGNPLATNKDFVNTKCPKCKGSAKRETDTMDTFFDSSWYFLRFCDTLNTKEPFNKNKVNYWMTVDQYIGGAEHACMHLIYARFFTKALRDMGYVKFDEPFTRLFNQGMLHGEDGSVMSKSAGNGVDPSITIAKYGTDSLRLFLVSVAMPNKDFAWSTTGIESVYKFLNKVCEYYDNIKVGKSSKKIESKVNKTIKEITADIEEFKYNLAVIKLRELFEVLESEKEIGKQELNNYLKLLSIFCPHLTEEYWEKLGNKGFISISDWPKYDAKKIDNNIEQQEQIIEKTIEDVRNILKIVKIQPKKVYFYLIPKEKEVFEAHKEQIERSLNLEVKFFAVNDKNKYDPQNKANKAKLGKPAIYLE